MTGIQMANIAKVIVRGLAPTGIISFLLVAGILLLVWKRHRAKAKYLFTAAILIYIPLGSGPVAFRFLGSLEYSYSPYEEFAEYRDVEDIVLLAGYAERDGDMPLSSHVNDSSAFRILEAARVFRLKPGRRIIISGMDDIPSIIKEVLVSLGIPEKSISVEGGSRSTIESAIHLFPLLKRKRIILVTSAGHMRRSVRIFWNHGIHPVPAPTDFMTKRNYLATSYLPNPRYLKMSDLAVHEYLGMILYGDEKSEYEGSRI